MQMELNNSFSKAISILLNELILGFKLCTSLTTIGGVIKKDLLATIRELY